MPILFRSAYATVEHRIASRMVRLARSADPFPDAGSARREVARWATCIEPLDVAALGLLLDWRLAPLTIDPELLGAVVSGTNVIGLRFARHAVLMVSPLGALQAKRLQNVHESEPVIFTDEHDAFGYVMGRE